jgi:hypothetical protein
MSQARSRFKSSTAFQDLLFNMLLGFVFLFMVALLLINPITKKADVPKKAEYLITLSWADESTTDVDLWVKSPSGKVASFINKNVGLLHLERDDLGLRNDTVTDRLGKELEVRINEETVTLRGIEAGEYEVMAHIYRKPVNETGGDITIKVMQINPYGVRYIGTLSFTSMGQAISLVRFELDADGKFLGFNNLPSNFIPSYRVSEAGA